MNKKFLRKLAEESYIKGNLDPENVKKISDLLKRTELKQFIKEIKIKENKKNIIISLPFMPNDEEQEKHKRLFPDKTIVYDIDPTLQVGLKITDNDLITEYNLKHTLENLYDHLKENYD